MSGADPRPAGCDLDTEDRIRRKCYRSGVPFQLRISVIDGGSITSVAALVRNRWPSGETTYCCRVSRLVSNSVRKSGTGGARTGVPFGPNVTPTDVNR